ncbi:MAG: putative toxin-antitoxin system toxin component, PIN family [Acidimicrobiia bacterium]|nr:putative toxin-antitoxin system toxin component, PIN family [Acidimicrobiia bacterium]
MKVFFDTNVVLAAFATRGLCADLFAHVLLEHELLVGETVIRELRSKLRIKLKLSKNAIDEIEALLRDQTVVNTPTAHLSLGISDSDDEWIVAEAMAGDADTLVTGDAALQKVGKRAPLLIVSPRGLWETLRGAEPAR